MPRRKNPVQSERIRLDITQAMPIQDTRVQKAFDWYMEKSRERKAAPLAWALLISALNGELGPQVQDAVERGNTEEAVDALHDLMSVFAQ